MFQEFDRTAGRLLHIEQAAQPFARRPVRLERVLRIVAARLVQPVRGDAGFGEAVHIGGADLDLDGDAVRAEQGGVQGLVPVAFRDRDVVLEAPGHRLVEIVQQAERAIAGIDAVNDHPDRELVEHLTERKVFLAHLAIHAVERLLASDHARVEPLLMQALGHHDLDLLHQLLAVAARPPDRLRQDAVAHRIQGREAQILEFVLERIDAEPVGDRRIDVERLAGDAMAFVHRHDAQGAHVVQAIGELDEDDADIVDHRQHHLLEIRGLLLRARIETEMGQLAQAVDQAGDGLAEIGLDPFPRHARVLKDVMQQRGDDAVGVEREFGDGAGDRQGVGDVGLTGQPLLALMGPGTEGVGPADAFQRVGLEARFEFGAEVVDRVAVFGDRRHTAAGHFLFGHAAGGRRHAFGLRPARP